MVAVAACAVPEAASAQSEVYSAVDGRLEVLWQAWGCAGIEGLCTGGHTDLICHKTNLRKGESASYHFKDGTSDRKVIIEHCSSNHESWDWTGNKGNKKRCAATKNGDTVTFKCGYTVEEYVKIKAGGALDAVSQ